MERMIVHKDPRCNLSAETSCYVFFMYTHQRFLGMNGDHSQISDNFVERIRQAFSRLFDSEIIDRRQYGNCLGPCYLTVVMDLPDSLRMNCKSGFGFFFLMFPPRPRESASVVQWLGSKSIDQKVMGLNQGG